MFFRVPIAREHDPIRLSRSGQRSKRSDEGPSDGGSRGSAVSPPANKKTSGFSLVETVLTMAVIGMLSAASAVVIGPVLDTWTLDTPRTEATDAAAFAMGRVVYEVAQIKDASNVLVANSGRLQFTDINDNVVDYQLSGTNLMRNADVLARGVQGLTFSYYNINSAALPSPQVSPLETDLWRVKVLITVARDGQSVTLESEVHPRNFPRG